MADHDPDSSPIDDHVLDAVTEAMVALHERYQRPKARSWVAPGLRLPGCLGLRLLVALVEVIGHVGLRVLVVPLRLIIERPALGEAVAKADGM